MLIALGVALLAATLVLSASHTRAQGDLDGSNFLMGVAAAVGLLGVAVAGWFVATEPSGRDELVAWPGAFGAVGAGLMIGVLMDDNAATGYVAGLLTVAIAVAGYMLVRRGAFVVATIVGLLVVYLSVFDDVLDAGDLDDDNFGVIIGVAVLVFTVAITVAGWFLPETRMLSALVAGVIAVVSNAGVLVGLAIAASFARAFGGMEMDMGTDMDGNMDGGGVDGGRGRAAGLDVFDNDAWWLLVFSLLLVAGWAYLAYTTGHVGFPLLMVAMCASVIPLVTQVLAVDHPTWWEVVVGLLGGGLLVVAGLRAMGARPPA